MKTSLPDYPFGAFNFNDDPIEQIGSFESILIGTGGLENQGFVSVSPLSPEDLSRTQKIDLQTTASWLWNLGYLAKKIEPKDIGKVYSETDLIQQALKQFQGEADLNVNGRVDNDTWYALNSLVGFESDTQINTWFRNNSPLPAFQRAIQLRLFALGLFDKKPELKFKPLTHKDLFPFIYVVHMFNLSDKTIGQGLFPDTMQLLFDQEQIIARVARSHNTEGTGFTVRILSELSKDNQFKLANKFIVNLAKVELWLLGFDIDIDGKDNYSIWQDMDSTESKLYQALSIYYQSFGNKSVEESAVLAKILSPAFFISLQNTYANISTQSEEDRGDASFEISLRLNTEQKIEKAWNYIKEKGLRLWDGLKRIWSWIKKTGKKIFSFIEENIFRAFFRYVSKSFKIVKKAIWCVTESIKTYLEGTLPTIFPDVLNIRFNKDFDYYLLLHPDISKDGIKECVDKLTHHAQVFQIGSQIFSLIFTIFKHVVTGFLGWSKLLLTLLRGLSEIKPLYQQLNALALNE